MYKCNKCAYDKHVDGYKVQPFINYWMSAMKFFGQGIVRNAQCSTNFDQFTRCYNNGASPDYGTFVLEFNLEGLHDSDDEFRSCMALLE